MMDWIEGLRNWLANVNWTAVWAAIISFSSFINIPAIASLVRSNVTLSKLSGISRSNGEFRFESLSRILKTVSFCSMVLDMMLSVVESEKVYAKRVSECKRASEIQSAASARVAELESESADIKSLSLKASALKDEFSKAEVSK